MVEVLLVDAARLERNEMTVGDVCSPEGLGGKLEKVGAYGTFGCSYSVMQQITVYRNSQVGRLMCRLCIQ